MSAPVIVISPDQLRELIREEVRAALAEHSRAEAPCEWVDSAGAAEILNLHRDTVVRRARLGDIPHSRIGAEYRFRRADLLGLLDGRNPGSDAR